MTTLATLWVSAVTVAALGSWLLFDASLGVNWPIWTLVASAGLAVCAGVGERRVPAAIWPPLVLACALAAGAPLTANPAFAALIVSGGLCLPGSVAALFGLFLGLQLSYLFGDPAAAVGSGVTYAEYARRGFAELSTAATLCALLILALSRWGARGDLDGGARAVSLLLLGETALLLVSAFRRVWLYEAAYGFTTARLYAQVYMMVLGLVLALLALELRERPVVQRLLRRAMGLGLAAVAALGCWNHEAWIASWNIDRAAETGRLDPGYLVWGLSPNAVPALVEGVGRLPAPLAADISARLRERYVANTRLRYCSWYEWNLGEIEAAHALYRAGVPIGGTREAEAPAGCVRLDPRRHWR